MPDRDWRVLVEDMLAHADRAQLHIVGLVYEIFEGDLFLQDGVLRCLEVLGEAARHVPDEVRNRAPEIPWSQIVATRHILAHHYNKVDLELVWRVVHERLPNLIVSLKALLAASE